MTKAEERALDFYPMKDYNKEPNYIHSCDSKMLDEVYREVFKHGYEQAEKDINKEMLEIMEKRKDTLLVDHDYDIHIEPAVGFGTDNIIVHYNDRIIEQLTWKDIKDIVRTADGLMYMAESLSDTEKRLGVQTYYEEVLRRFKAIKKEKK